MTPVTTSFAEQLSELLGADSVLPAYRLDENTSGGLIWENRQNEHDLK